MKKSFSTDDGKMLIHGFSFGLPVFICSWDDPHFSGLFRRPAVIALNDGSSSSSCLQALRVELDLNCFGRCGRKKNGKYAKGDARED
jgi:hypothetical protein